MDLSGQIVSPFLAYLIDEQVKFQDVADQLGVGVHLLLEDIVRASNNNNTQQAQNFIAGHD